MSLLSASATSMDWHDRAGVHRCLAELEPARQVEFLELGLSQLPDDGFLHGLIGKLFLADGQLDVAERHLQKGVDSNPEDGSLLFHLYQLKQRLDQSAEARRWLEKAVDKGHNADHTVLLYRDYLADELYPDALSIAQQGVQWHPRDSRFVCACAEALERLEGAQAALAWLEHHDLEHSRSVAALRYQLINAHGSKSEARAAHNDYLRRVILSQPDYRQRLLSVLDAIPSDDSRLALTHLWQQRLEQLSGQTSSIPTADQAPRIAMSILVRDEVDIIEHNIRFHAAHGIQHFVVTDNGSVDGTRELLESLKAEFSLHIIDEPAHTIDQDLWVTRMAQYAQATTPCDWIINNDADEFWVPARGSLADSVLDALASFPDAHRVGVLACKRLNMLTCNDRAQLDSYRFHDSEFAAVANVPLLPGEQRWNDGDHNSVARCVMDKVLTRLNGLGAVDYGNHGAAHELEKRDCSAITILHYPVRSFAQFERKVVNYGQSLEANTRFSKGSSLHLRYWYKQYLAGNLQREYEQITFSTDRLDQLQDTGYLTTDARVRHFFEHATRALAAA